MADSGFTLITGASSGIGRELAIVAAENGRNLVLVARREEKLEELGRELGSEHGVRSEIVASDLSAPEAPVELYEEVSRRGLRVDRLVNNAGFGSLGAFRNTPIEKQLEMLRLNVLALTHLTHLFLQPMVERGSGRILNLASTAAFQPGPLMAVYYASKAYVLSFTEAIAEELKGTGVTATALCPGPTKTEFQQTADMESSRLLRLGLTGARPVAELGYRAMERGRVVAVPGLMNRLGAFAVRLSPRAVIRPLVKSINEAPGRAPSP